ncbi:hypothetical protein ABT336_25785, partial [Micromonospora sp. NPDC000207]
MTDSAPADGESRVPPSTPSVDPATPTPGAETDEQSVPEAPPATLWDRMRQDPQYAPEHLAMEAVRRLGPEAARWAGRIRAEQPGVPADAQIGRASLGR